MCAEATTSQRDMVEIVGSALRAARLAVITTINARAVPPAIDFLEQIAFPAPLGVQLATRAAATNANPTTTRCALVPTVVSPAARTV